MVGSRGASGREEFVRYAKGAITIPGPAISRLESIAARHNVFIVTGVIEQDTASSTLFCTAVYVSPSRGYIGKHRKLMPTASERLIWGQGDETTISVVDADLRTTDDRVDTAKLAATICWEKCVDRLCASLIAELHAAVADEPVLPGSADLLRANCRLA